MTKRNLFSVFSIISIITIISASLFPVTTVFSREDDSHGNSNNGTIKVHNANSESEPVVHNEPQVCTFHLHGFNFDDHQDGDWKIKSWEPTGNGTIVLNGQYHADHDGKFRYPGSTTYSLPNGHYKLFWQDHNMDKQKVFWVECAATPSPTPTQHHTPKPTHGCNHTPTPTKVVSPTCDVHTPTQTPTVQPTAMPETSPTPTQPAEQPTATPGAEIPDVTPTEGETREETDTPTPTSAENIPTPTQTQEEGPTATPQPTATNAPQPTATNSPSNDTLNNIGGANVDNPSQPSAPSTSGDVLGATTLASTGVATTSLAWYAIIIGMILSMGSTYAAAKTYTSKTS